MQTSNNHCEVVVDDPDLEPSNGRGVIRVLLVDDDASIREISKLILSNLNNFEIDQACCVDEAFKKLASGHFDIIVSDYDMPTKDGLQFLKELRERSNEIPFILFTGKGREEVAITALNLGADGYLNKQGDPETVYGELSHSIEMSVDRYKLKLALVESEKRYRSITEKSVFGIYVIQDAKMAYVNPSFARTFGYLPEEIIDKLTPRDLIHPDDIQAVMRRLEERLDGKIETGNVVYKAVKKDGSVIHIEVYGTTIVYQGKPAVIGTLVDVTQRKKAETLLKESESRFRGFADSLPEIIFDTDITGKLVYANERAFEITGYSKDDFDKGLCAFDFIFQEDRQRARKDFRRAFENDPSGKNEYALVRKDGSTFPVMIVAKPIVVENATIGLRGIIIDISERRKAENALKENEERSRAIVANAPIGIATSDSDKHFLSANEAFCRIIGYTEEELQKLTFKDITHSSDLKESILKLQELENGSASSFAFEKRYVRKDGIVIYGKIMVSAVRDQNGKPSLFIAELEDVTERKKAEERRKVLERKVTDYSNNLKYLVDLRTAQLKDANERLVKSERLAAIGELAGMVGHDLRNPLTSIKNAAYFLKKKGSTVSEAQVKEMLEIIDKSVVYSDKIINDLLEYSREIHLEPIRCKARTLLDEALQMVQIPRRIKIENQVYEETWIWVNVDKMLRVFVNLIKNAVDAMPEKGTLEIRCCQTRDCVEIAFADTGTGISEDTLPKLFLPLFTTKAQGMGFGLAICKRIVEAHGGTITVETTENMGTTFIVTLPLKPKADVED